MNNNFDKALNQKLGEFSVPYDSSEWESFSENLSSATGDTDFDTAVQEKLEEYEPEEEPYSWFSFLEALESWEALRSQIFVGKVIEASFIILISLLIFPIIISDKPDVFRESAAKIAEEENIRDKEPLPANETFNDVTVKGEQASNDSRTLSDISGRIPDVKGKATYPVNGLKEVSSIEQEAFISHTGSTIFISQWNEEEKSLGEAEAQAKTVPIREVQELRITEDLRVIKPSQRRGIKFSPFFIDVVYGRDFFNVFSSYNPYSRTAAVERKADGSRIGARFGWKMTNAGIMLGLIYHKFSYQSNNQSFITRSMNSRYLHTLDEVQLGYLDLPVLLEVDVINTGRVSGYMKFGLHMNMLVKNQYIETVEHLQLDIAQNISYPSNARIGNVLKVGAFNGILPNQIFFTYSAGVGVNYSLHPNYQLFTEVTHGGYLSADGIGLNNDKIYSNNLVAGMRMFIR